MNGNTCGTPKLMRKFNFAAQKYFGHFLEKY
jgi:hypothetical protein